MRVTNVQSQKCVCPILVLDKSIRKMSSENRPLDMDWLQDFIALADAGSFSRAAVARGIAQPALSRHIRALEEWVGCDLVDRGAHPARLTEAGKRFQPDIEDLLERLAAARNRANAATARAAASLQFAATHALSLTFFPLWLSGLEDHVRLGPIQMMSDSFSGCEDLMLQQKVQFLLCHGHVALASRLDALHFSYHVVGLDELLPVCAPGVARLHAQAGDEPQCALALPLLRYGLESGLGKIMRSQLSPTLDESRFRPVFTAHHAVLLKTLALERRGLAWLPKSLVSDELTSGRLEIAGDRSWCLPIEIRLMRARAQLPTQAEALWTAVTKKQESIEGGQFVPSAQMEPQSSIG